MLTIEPTTFRGRPAVALRNARIGLTILAGGGHIASIKLAQNPVNPLWEPLWPALEPNLRALASDRDYGDPHEGVMLSSIAGHNLCCDVFGAHSDAEEALGLTYHGEAGMVAWSVESADCRSDQATLVMRADLLHTAMTIQRSYQLAANSQTVRVQDTFVNKVGFQRALGVAQHATVGGPFLGSHEAPTLFAANADQGVTWPQPYSELSHGFAVNQSFAYPNVPSLDGTAHDWRRYPRHEVNGDLCSLRINPPDEVAWFSAYNPTCGLTLAYAWQRAHYPWLQTWEENHFRRNKPWDGKELTRGMEFSSYAFALSRKENVELGKLLETPCYTWLDAYEQRTTRFALCLVDQGHDRSEAPKVAVDDGWQIALT